MFDMVNLRAGVNNIFDKRSADHPDRHDTRFVPDRVRAPATPTRRRWDYLGRFLYAGATIDFKHKPTPIAPPPVIAPPPPPPAAPATITCPDGLVILAEPVAARRFRRRLRRRLRRLSAVSKRSS